MFAFVADLRQWTSAIAAVRTCIRMYEVGTRTLYTDAIRGLTGKEIGKLNFPPVAPLQPL